MPEQAFRVLPKLSDLNRHFWTGGAQGRLCFLRCGPCGTYVHPPAPVCPACLSRDVAPAAVSGRATVASVTLNHQAWVPTPDLPYAIAIVEIEEQPGLRLVTNVVNCEPASVRIGMPVRVVFEPHDGVWVPLFEPAGA